MMLDKIKRYIYIYIEKYLGDWKMPIWRRIRDIVREKLQAVYSLKFLMVFLFMVLISFTLTDGEVFAVPRMSLSSDTINMVENIEVFPDGDMRVLTQKLTLSTDNATGVRIFVSSKGDNSAPVLTEGSSLVGIQPAIGDAFTPLPLSSNTFGFAIARDNSVGGSTNGNNLASLGDFSETNLYTSKHKDAKYAKMGNKDHMIEIYRTDTKIENKPIVLFYGINTNFLLDEGTYNMDIIYTIVSGETGNISISNDKDLTIYPKVLPRVSGGDYLEILASPVMINTRLEPQDIDFKVNNKRCTDAIIVENTTNKVNTGNDLKHNTDELFYLKFKCKAPPNSDGKKDISLQITKGGTRIFDINVADAVEYKKLRPMQSLTAEECASMSEHDVKEMFDIRDDNIYRVVKLKDGKCWMVQNLRLLLSEERKLSRLDTDIDNDWLPSRSTEVSSGEGGLSGQGGGVLWHNDPEGYNTIRSIYNKKMTNIDGTVYYSFGAATAGSGGDAVTAGANARGSICPKGWRLPTSSNVYKQGELWNLSKAYQGTARERRHHFRGGHILLNPPASFDFTGYYSYDGYFNNIGKVGYWWSSTASSNSFSYLLYQGSSSLDPHDEWRRYNGIPVRCVLRDNI